jgi:hypothetical protein
VEATHDETGGFGETGVPECLPAQGISPAECDLYAENAWWLPKAYVENAWCACTSTPDDATANCVRKFLQDRLRSSYSENEKNYARDMKLLMEESQPYAYKAWVIRNLTQRIYQDHVDAYEACCCPCGPAPYEAWMAVTTVPLGSVPGTSIPPFSCNAIGASILQHGPCHCVPGEW